jgi:hypothetical protein
MADKYIASSFQEGLIGWLTHGTMDGLRTDSVTAMQLGIMQEAVAAKNR